MSLENLIADAQFARPSIYLARPFQPTGSRKPSPGKDFCALDEAPSYWPGDRMPS